MKRSVVIAPCAVGYRSFAVDNNTLYTTLAAHASRTKFKIPSVTIGLVGTSNHSLVTMGPELLVSMHAATLLPDLKAITRLGQYTGSLLSCAERVPVVWLK